LAKARRRAQVGAIYDAVISDRFILAMIDAMRKSVEFSGPDGTARFASTEALAGIDFGEQPEVHRIAVEQSNNSVIIGERAVLKIFRRLIPGEHPEIEVARFLTQTAHYTNTPPLLGTAEQLERDGTLYALAVLTGYIRNQGDAWTFTVDYLDRVFDGARLVEETGPIGPAERHAVYLEQIRILGRRTAELHRALASDPSTAAFVPEPIGPADLDDWGKALIKQAATAFTSLKKSRNLADESLCELIDIVLAQEEKCTEAIRLLSSGEVSASKIRIHGDYHLGQVLQVKTDYVILDFEGEPARPLGERCAKSSPLKDVAGMVRSLSYAAYSGLIAHTARRPEDWKTLEPWARLWERSMGAEFLRAYRNTAQNAPFLPSSEDGFRKLLAIFLLDKALYELSYELNNRPTWVRVPLMGILSLPLEAGGREWNWMPFRSRN